MGIDRHDRVTMLTVNINGFEMHLIVLKVCAKLWPYNWDIYRLNRTFYWVSSPYTVMHKLFNQIHGVYYNRNAMCHRLPYDVAFTHLEFLG